MKTTAKSLYNKINKLKKQYSFNYEELADYLNGEQIYTLKGEIWTKVALKNFMTNHSKNKAAKAKKAAPVEQFDDFQASVTFQPEHQEENDWEVVLTAIMSTNLAAPTKFKAIKAFVTNY